jgi:hypothetical protein
MLALLLTVSPSVRHEAARIAVQAKADRQAGEFKNALREAQKAYALVPKPGLLLEIAEDHRGLGNWTEATTFYERYLATRPTGPGRALVKKRLAEAKGHAGQGGGDVLALAPLTATPLVAPAAPPPEAPLPPPPIVELSAPPPAAPVAAVTEPPPASGGEVTEAAPRHSRALAYSLIGIGAAAAVVAVVGWVEVSSYDGYVGTIASGTPASQAISRYNQANTWQVVAIATSIAAGLAGGAVAFTW